MQASGTDGVDGEEIHLTMPSESEVSSLVATTEFEHKKRMEMIQPIPDIEEPSGQEGAELSKIPVDLKSGDWFLKIVPWIGGRIIISIAHFPSDSQWLHSRIEINGYEEYSGTEYRSAACTEDYKVIRYLFKSRQWRGDYRGDRDSSEATAEEITATARRLPRIS